MKTLLAAFLLFLGVVLVTPEAQAGGRGYYSRGYYGGYYGGYRSHCAPVYYTRSYCAPRVYYRPAPVYYRSYYPGYRCYSGYGYRGYGGYGYYARPGFAISVGF